MFCPCTGERCPDQLFQGLPARAARETESNSSKQRANVSGCSWGRCWLRIMIPADSVRPSQDDHRAAVGDRPSWSHFFVEQRRQERNPIPSAFRPGCNGLRCRRDFTCNISNNMIATVGRLHGGPKTTVTMGTEGIRLFFTTQLNNQQIYVILMVQRPSQYDWRGRRPPTMVERERYGDLFVSTI